MNFQFRFAGLAFAAAAIVAIMPGVDAQGWGEYDRGYDPRPMPPYPPGGPGGPGQPPYGQSQPGYGQPVYGQQNYGQAPGRAQANANPNPRCRELEFQLAGGLTQGPSSQDQLPRLEAEMRQMDMQFHRAQADAERADCYEDMFLFGRSLKRTPRCIDLDQQVQTAKGRLAQLKAQRDALVRGNMPRGRRDDIIADLARNRCGDNYVREYEAQRNRNSSIFSFFTEEAPDDTGQYTPSFSSSTYRTLCVRLCDGFYFPVSNATTESHFQEDEAKCHSQCAAPAELYTHRSDQDVEQMVSLSGRPYTAMPNAFRNRKVYIRGCSCNQSEYSVEEIAKSEEALKQQSSKRADASGGGKLASDVTAAIRSAPKAPASSAPQPAASQPSANAAR